MSWAGRVRATAVSAVAALALVGMVSTATAAEPTPEQVTEATTAEPTPEPTPTPTPPEPEPTPTPPEPEPTPTPPEPQPEPTPTPPPPTSGTPKPATTSRPPTTTTPTPTAPIWRPPRTLPALDEEPPPSFEPLTATTLKSQIAEAERVTAALTASTSRVAVATREMDALAAKSNALLESLDAARETERAAKEEAERARVDLAALDARLEKARDVVREWVFLVYSGGGGTSDVAFMLEAMAAQPQDVGDPLGDLAYLTEQRTRALDDVRVLTAEQVRLTAAAQGAGTQAAAATAAIASDSSELAKVVEAQRARVGELRRLQIAEVEKAGPVATVLVGARTPAAKAAAARLRAALAAAGGSAEVASVGKPCSDDTSTYPNGLYPPSALCPLWGAPGERLSPSAAAAFNALSKAYAAQTGIPICVTDSYRSLPEQISVKATHGRFAATPGTSRHGLGRALDLCGGVQDFSSPAHRWMKANGPLYGWFHPSWAAAGGSLPEPWHFEYAG